MATLETIQSERRATAKRMLEGYRSFCGMHDSLLKLMQDADSRLTSTTAQMSETVASGTAKDAIGSGIAKLEEASKQLEHVDGMIRAKQEITTHLVMRVIEQHPQAGSVLEKRYLVPASEEEPLFEDIADALGYSVDWTYQLHLIGLDIVASLLEDNKKKQVIQ